MQVRVFPMIYGTCGTGGTGGIGGIGGTGEDSLFQLKTRESLYTVRVLSRLRQICSADVAVHALKTALTPAYIEIYFSCYVFSIF